MNSRTYSELIRYQTFEDRLHYLMLYGSVGVDTFGFDRYLNQMLYHSTEWRRLRNYILMRDKGCDLGVEGYEIFSKPIIHHINPITVEDVKLHSEKVFDENNLITVSLQTHNLIHYGFETNGPKIVERQPNDTKLW